jgi:hypothetical protein
VAVDIAQFRFLYGEASVDLEDERQFARNPEFLSRVVGGLAARS